LVATMCTYFIFVSIIITMENFFQSALDYLTKAGISTGLQLIILFGPLLIMAIIMHFIALANERMSIYVFGEKIYLYVFAWLGTSIHELGHALFAVIFGHKIKEIQLFKPDPQTGTMGYVNHSYDEKNMYQQTGNFFIGIGPLLMCTIVLYGLSLLLFRINIFDFSDLSISPDTLGSFSLLKTELLKLPTVVSQFMHEIFSGENSAWWKIMILIYCLYSIGSSMTLSPADIKTSGRGFLVIIIIVFIFNISTLWAGDFATEGLTKISFLFSGFYTLMALAMAVNIIFAAITGFFRLGIQIFKKK